MATGDPPHRDERCSGEGRGADAHGQAALLLVESLIHLLVERQVIRPEDAVDAADTAVEVQAARADDMGDPPSGGLRLSTGLLEAIASSLRADISRP